MTTKSVPFGLRFAEAPRRETGLKPNSPHYDPDLALSFVVDEHGQRQPFVLWAWEFAGDTRTGTTTKAEGDAEDTDEDRTPRTQTVTETRENTDSDY